MANVENFELGNDLSAVKSALQLVQIGQDKINVIVPLEGLVDLGAEIARLQKNMEKVLKDIEITKKKLSDENFMKNAPEEIRETEKVRLDQLNEQAQTIQASLKRLQ